MFDLGSSIIVLEVNMSCELHQNLKTTVCLFVGIIAAVSCQSSHKKVDSLGMRSPASDVSPLLEKYYSESVQIDFIKDKEQIKEQKKSTSSSSDFETKRKKGEKAESDKILDLQKSSDSTLAELKNAFPNVDEPTGIKVNFSTQWREHHDDFILHKLEPYEVVGGKVVKELPLSYSTSKNMIVQLTNILPTPEGIAQDSQPYLQTTIKCDQSAVLHETFSSSELEKNKPKNIRWYYPKRNAQKLYLQLPTANTECEFRFKPVESTSGKEYGIKFVPENLELVGSPQEVGQICLMPKVKRGVAIGSNGANLTSDSEESFLFDQKNMTCPEKLDDFETLEESKEAINAKVKLLIGQNLPAEIYEKADPFTKLDFSKAPKLDLILLSYLVFRADFGGHLLEQALRYHAARGTPIRIAVSDVISLGKDRQMLLDLQADYSNVKLLFYKYKSQGLGIKDWVSSFHRTNHIKLFLTYSKTEPQANQVILGGRNIHDGFVFDQPNSNYIIPSVVTYGKGGDEAFAHWEDFEVRFTSPDLVRTLMGQFFATLHADYTTVHIRNFNESIALEKEINPEYFNLGENQIILRSMVSIPYKDGRNLEKYYVRLIDSAKKTLKLSSPYLNLTKEVFDALVRASGRGVEIQVITRLDLKGDTADIILSDVNKKAVNKLYKNVKIFEYTTSGKILHTKLVIVDDKLVSMGSVNLNLRSFNHDLENSSLIYSQKFSKRINELFERYKTETRPITEAQKTTFWKRIIIEAIGTAL